MWDKFWDWVDRRIVIRRIALFIMMWMTWQAFAWAALFAEKSIAMGAGWDVGAIIAAVTAPIAALQGYVFNMYNNAKPRKDD